MAKKAIDEPGVLSKAGVVVGALALVPAILTLSYLTDDSASRAQARAERIAAQDEKYRQIMYGELNRRLGNQQPSN